jgi:hypothetical protein
MGKGGSCTRVIYLKRQDCNLIGGSRVGVRHDDRVRFECTVSWRRRGSREIGDQVATGGVKS